MAGAAVPLAIAALDRSRILTINGSDFGARDGTAIQDYVHVADLARAHAAAAENARRDWRSRLQSRHRDRNERRNWSPMPSAASQAPRINVRYGPRRPGDLPTLVAARAKAEQHLQWVPQHSKSARSSKLLSWHRRRAAQMESCAATGVHRRSKGTAPEYDGV